MMDTPTLDISVINNAGSLAVPFAPKEGTIIHPCSRRWINNLPRHTSGHQRTDFAAAATFTPAEPFPGPFVLPIIKVCARFGLFLGHIVGNDTRVETRASGDPLGRRCVFDGSMRVERPGQPRTLNGTVDLSPLRETGPSTRSEWLACVPVRLPCLPACVRICVCVNTRRFGYARMPTDESWPRSVTIWEHDR